jgi:AhpD family alkylhydroperoxidase
METTTLNPHDAAMARMKEQVPELPRAFGPFFSALMKPGALSLREKELIALGIALALRCEPCIWSHVEKCLKAGATRQQVLDAGSVAIVMQGGPAYTYIPKLLEALDHHAPLA